MRRRWEFFGLEMMTSLRERRWSRGRQPMKRARERDSEKKTRKHSFWLPVFLFLFIRFFLSLSLFFLMRPPPPQPAGLLFLGRICRVRWRPQIRRVGSRVVSGCTGLYRVVPGCTGFWRVGMADAGTWVGRNEFSGLATGCKMGSTRLEWVPIGFKSVWVGFQ